MRKPSDRIVRLIYASRIAKRCGPNDLEEILNVSRRNNQAVGVTGALCYCVRGFLQCLEGPREPVNALYRRIVQDDRNEETTLIAYAPEQERCFGQWSMAYVRADDVDQAILSQHGVATPFDPYTVSEEQALGLLQDITRERAAFLAQQKKNG